jgi:hypothetical protein
MTDQLETDLREALRARAAQVPESAAVRLTRQDYHPRTHRLRPPLAIGALATGAAAGTAAVVISLGAGASNAFAGWSPTPTPPAPGQLVGAQASCEQSQSPIAGLPLQLSDTRGPFTFSIYADSTSSATCIKGPSFTAVSGSMSSYPINVPAGHILLSSSHATERAGQAYSLADGRTGSDVTGVTLTLDDGSTVRATVGNGWFVAWWPGSQVVKSAELATSAGTTTQSFDLPAAPSVPAGARGASSSSSMGSSAGGGATSGFSIQGSSNSGSGNSQ